MKYLIALITVTALLIAPPARAAIQSQEVQYRDGETQLNGYIAYDDSFEGKRPGVIVVHEWWGHNDYARRRADMLARLGYVGFALDMYGDGKLADHPDTAGEFSKEVSSRMDTVGKRRFEAALDVLKNFEFTDPDKIAAIGYCFGGGVVLHMARFGEDLKGVVSFHGSLGTTTPAQPGMVKARILVYNGADDPFTTPEQIAAFKKEMDDAGADYQFVNLPGAMHSFTNPEADTFAQRFGMPLAYNKEADTQSWAGAKAFLNEIFQ